MRNEIEWFGPIEWMTGNAEVTPVKSVVGVPRVTGKWRLELPGGKFIQRAQPLAKVGSAQAPLPVQPAQKLFGRALAFFGVAIYAARHQVSIGIPSQLRPRHDVVEAPPERSRGPPPNPAALRRYNP
jgi:hypothetical protein